MRGWKPHPLEAQVAELRQRLAAAEIQIGELRGMIHAQNEHIRRERADREAELQRFLELLRGPVAGAGLEALSARLSPQPRPSPVTDEFRGRWGEVHGGGISQAEMIERKRKRHGADEAPAEQG